MKAEQNPYVIPAMALWIPKALGAILTFTLWPIVALVVVLAPIGGVDPRPSLLLWVSMALFVGLWPLLYFRGLCPLQRLYSERVVAWQKGFPIPDRPTPLTGSAGRRLADSFDRTIGQFDMRGVAMHPSEDGNYDLGQTPFARTTASQLGYANNPQVYPHWSTVNCRACGHPARGSRQCPNCGTFIHGDGTIDHEAESYR